MLSDNVVILPKGKNNEIPQKLVISNLSFSFFGGEDSLKTLKNIEVLPPQNIVTPL